MFNNINQKNQLYKHKKHPKKSFQYSLRLDEHHYKMLHHMAIKSTMAEIIDRAIEVEFDYQLLMEDFFKKMPKFQTRDDVDRWVVYMSKSKPELLNQLAKAGAIYAYNKLIEKDKTIRQNYLNDLDAITYLINKIGVNLNQLTKRANSGFNISKEELDEIKDELSTVQNEAIMIRKAVM